MKDSDAVDESELYKLFSSDEFLRKLKIGGGYVVNRGIESGFSVYRGNDRKFYFSGIAEGDKDGCDEADYDDSGQYQIMGLHFHTNRSGPIIPSYDDLCRANRDDLVLGHLLGVGKVKGDRTIDILLLQRAHRLSLVDIEKLFNKTEGEDFSQDYFHSTSEVARFYEDSEHYKSEVITFRLENRLHVPDFFADKFRKFSFCP